MSVLSSSVWINDDASPKKKSSIRKTIKRQPDTSGDLNHYSNNEPKSITDVQYENDTRSVRVNELMNQMAFLNENNDGNSLADFKPLSNPELTVSRMDQESNLMSIPNEVDNLENATVGISNIHGPSTPPFDPINRRGGSTDFASNNTDLTNLRNYSQSYDSHEKSSYRPYYTNMGIGGGRGDDKGGGGANSKVMEKINYMIHMMEEQQFERTNNVMEEFILYSFLGIFVIFIVDSFSRIGKYTR